MKSVVLTSAANRQWSKLPADARKRIGAKLDAYAASGAGDVRSMKGQDGARLRVGDYRAVFIEDDATITVVAVGHRREVYD